MRLKASGHSKRWTLITMCFSLFMVGVDTTVVNLALPAIQRSFSATFSELQWIVDSFILIVACLMLTGGTMGDLYGRKRVFLLGTGAFTAGSVLCALAPTAAVLILGRSIQGIGAATMMPATLSILTNTYKDPRERAHAIGIWAGVSGTALAIGPVLGGFLVDIFGWQSIFWINVPIGLAALLLAGRVIVESTVLAGRSLDIPGQLLSIVALGSLTYALIEANRLGWTSPVILAAFVLATVALTAFLAAEARSRRPMLRLSFFTNRTFTGANIAGLAMYFGFFSVLFFLGLFLQNVQGYSAAQAGLVQLPMTVLGALAAVASGRVVAKIGSRVPITAGLLILGASLLLLTSLRADSPYSSFWWILALCGTGQGLVMSPLTTAVMSTVPSSYAGVASATATTSRQLGGVLGVAVLGSVVTTRYTALLHASIGQLDLGPALEGKVVAAARTAQGSYHGSFAGVDAETVLNFAGKAFASAFATGMWIGGAAILLGATTAFLMIRHRPTDSHPAESE